MTRVMIAVEITPGEDGRCWECRGTHSSAYYCEWSVWREIPTTLERQRGEYLRGPTCIAAEKLLRDVVEAGEGLKEFCGQVARREGLVVRDIDAWDSAIAALKETP